MAASKTVHGDENDSAELVEKSVEFLQLWIVHVFYSLTRVATDGPQTRVEAGLPSTRANGISLRHEHRIDGVDDAIAGSHISRDDLGFVHRDLATFDLYIQALAVDGLCLHRLHILRHDFAG